jgi:hypothetical protein
MSERQGIFVFEGHDAIVFWSFDEAARWLEPPEVEKGGYDIFTLDGHVVSATAAGERVTLTVTGALDVEGLADRLRRTCAEYGFASTPDDIPAVADELYRRDW